MSTATAIIGVVTVVIAATVVMAAIAITEQKQAQSEKKITPAQKAVKSVCNPTDHKDECEKSLSNSTTTEPKGLIMAGFRAAITEIENVMAKTDSIEEETNNKMARKAVDACNELLGYAIDDLHACLDQLRSLDVARLDQYVENLKVWSGATITYQETCLDGFMNVSDDTGKKMESLLHLSRKLTSNGLAMVSDLSNTIKDANGSGHSRKLLGDNDGFPSWVSSRQRRLLQQTPATMNPNVVVAQDGTGKYRSINEALQEVPEKNVAPFVIHIKAGVYQEQVLVDKKMGNVVFVGDGPRETVITGRLNYVDGTVTMKTATVAALGPKFIAKDIGFENTAGAIGHQAVALRVQSDQSVFYNCHMDGYQDTLYAHTHRQFYRDCTISGTINFLFGDASVVFQNCMLIVRKPLDNQKCIVTAQGRKEHRQVSGIVLQNCTIAGDPEYILVKDAIKTHLGRPWKEFSRTIIMQSQLDDIVVPEGWMPWEGDFALETLWYAEFNNRGPGADQKRRVQWKGIQKIDDAQAKEFTPGVFLRGDEFIPSTGAPYTPGMMPDL